MRTDDGCIIRECLGGESEAFGVLVDKYKGGIYAFAYAKLGNFQDAQDVTQEAFLKAYRNLRSLRQWESFGFWLYRIAYNLCGEWIKARARRPDREFIEDQDPRTLAGSSLDSHREYQLDESVQDALDSLPQAYREVLMLHYFGGMNSKEIARVLGTSPTAVRMRLSRARAQLREEMVAMMDTAFEGHRLQASFTFRIVEGVKRIKINPMPRMTALPWGLSVAAGITIAVLSLSPHLDILIPASPPAASAPPNPATALENGEISVDVMKISQMPFISAMQSDGNSENSRLQNALLRAPAAEGNTWAEKADIPIPGVTFGVGVVKGKLYVIGGATDPRGETLLPHVHEYDPATGTWTRKADIPTLRINLSSATVNGKIYVIGGSVAGDTSISVVEEYDPATDKWTRKSDMPTGRCWMGSCVLDEKIYAIAGAGDGFSPVSSVEVYDPATDTWTKEANAPTRRMWVAAAAVNGRIYAIGGADNWNRESYMSRVEEYDPATRTWTRKADMPTTRGQLTTSVVDGKIYAIGGFDSVNSLSEMEEYDPATDTWTNRANMPNLRAFHSSVVMNGRIYVIGGTSTAYPNYNHIPSIAEYTPPGRSSSVPPLSPQGKLPTKWGETKSH